MHFVNENVNNNINSIEMHFQYIGHAKKLFKHVSFQINIVQLKLGLINKISISIEIWFKLIICTLFEHKKKCTNV